MTTVLILTIVALLLGGLLLSTTTQRYTSLPTVVEPTPPTFPNFARSPAPKVKPFTNDGPNYLNITLEQLEAEQLITHLVGPNGELYETKLNVNLHYTTPEGQIRPIRELVARKK